MTIARFNHSQEYTCMICMHFTLVDHICLDKLTPLLSRVTDDEVNEPKERGREGLG